MSRPTVLHVTFDFPTPLAVPHMTRAVERLVESAREFRNVVYAMTRVCGLGNEFAALRYAPDRVAVAYWSPPKGLMLHTTMRRIARWIANDLRERDIAINLIHAHKLTTDGIVASCLAREFGVPYVCSIWGDADSWVAHGRPDLHGLWREIATSARALLAAAPWAVTRFSAMLRIPRDAIALLPVMGGATDPVPSTTESEQIVSVFHLEHWRRKGAAGLVEAMRATAQDGPGWRLDIIGGGSARSFIEVAGLIARAGADNRIRLAGPVENRKVQGILGNCALLALPSRRETFGMAFIEALFAGIPVLYPAGWAIDGFLPPERIGYACRADDLADVTNGLRHVMDNQMELKDFIARLQAEGALESFTSRSIALGYRNHLNAALA